jgi:hypothetical protein
MYSWVVGGRLLNCQVELTRGGEGGLIPIPEIVLAVTDRYVGGGRGVSPEKNARYGKVKKAYEESEEEYALVREMLAVMKGRQIRLPNKQNVWPARKHLEWHRNHTFLG